MTSAQCGNRDGDLREAQVVFFRLCLRRLKWAAYGFLRPGKAKTQRVAGGLGRLYGFLVDARFSRLFGRGLRSRAEGWRTRFRGLGPLRDEVGRLYR